MNSHASVLSDNTTEDVKFVSPQKAEDETSVKGKKIVINEEMNETVEIPLRGSGRKVNRGRNTEQ